MLLLISQADVAAYFLHYCGYGCCHLRMLSFDLMPTLKVLDEKGCWSYVCMTHMTFMHPAPTSCILHVA